MDKNCLSCGNVYFKKVNTSLKNWQNSKTCSQKCYYISRKGKPTWNKGIPMSVETRKKVEHTFFKKGFKHKPETIIKFRNIRCGEQNNMWKGGVTPENKKIRQSSEYKEWRTSVFERDNYTCVICNVRSGKNCKVTLNADHIKPFAVYPDLRFDITNGRTLCVECHKKTETYGVNLKYQATEKH